MFYFYWLYLLCFVFFFYNELDKISMEFYDSRFKVNVFVVD